MWDPNNKIEFCPSTRPGQVTFTPFSHVNNANGSTSKFTPMISAYPFIAGQSHQYRPTPLLVCPSLVNPRPVVHASPVVHYTSASDTDSLQSSVSTIGPASSGGASWLLLEHLSRNGTDFGISSSGTKTTNSISYSATPMTNHQRICKEGAAAISISRPLSPQPSTSGLVRRPQKRKSTDSNESNPYGGKVFINEEKMATCLQDLSLSSGISNISAPNTKPKAPLSSLPLSSWLLDGRKPHDAQKILDEIESRLCVEDIESDAEDDQGAYPDFENNNNNEPEGRRLMFSKELEIGLQKTKDILPNILLKQITKPCLELVLWKPPGHHVKDAIQNAVTSSATTNMSCWHNSGVDRSALRSSPPVDMSSLNTDVDMTLPTQARTKPSGNSLEDGHHPVATEVRPGVTIEDLFDSVDDEMEL